MLVEDPMKHEVGFDFKIVAWVQPQLSGDLDHEFSNFFFSSHTTLWLMVMYHQTKFGCQEINSSEFS